MQRWNRRKPFKDIVWIAVAILFAGVLWTIAAVVVSLVGAS